MSPRRVVDNIVKHGPVLENPVTRGSIAHGVHVITLIKLPLQVHFRSCVFSLDMRHFDEKNYVLFLVKVFYINFFTYLYFPLIEVSINLTKIHSKRLFSIK